MQCSFTDCERDESSQLASLLRETTSQPETNVGWSAVRPSAERFHMDIVLASHWRIDGKIVSLRVPGGREVNDSPRSEDNGFTWRRGKVEILLSREGDAWRVSQTTAGRLFGPRHVVYEQRHKLVRPAALDFMARVIRETKNEEEGIRVARAASRWMNEDQQSERAN
jgi:hypothetical protein